MTDSNGATIPDQADSDSPPVEARRAAASLLLTLVILGGYGLLAYLVLPVFWTHYEHQRGLARCRW